MLRYLLEKEFKQIRRDRFMPKIIFIIPIMQLIILPFAANFEMRNINLSIVDNDHSVTSMQLVDKVLSSGYFRLTDRSDRYDEALTSVESNESDIILEIPSDFERDLGKEGRADVMIAANAVNGTKGGLGSSYLSSIIQDFNREPVQSPLELQDLYGSRHHGILADDYRGIDLRLEYREREGERDDRADKRLARTQVPVPAVEADPFLGDRLCPADGGDPHRLADLRLGAGGEFRGDLFVCRRIFDRFYGIWLGDLLLLVHTATSDAYGVFLLDHFRLAKRIVHADQQYAGMGAEDHAGEPGALFRGGDAYGLFKGERLCRFTGTFRDCLSICCFF